MKSVSLEDNKAIQLEILNDIDIVCRENSLTYFLAYGTLIGAIRHKGYIPWDDDIDIQMPRDDYNKMIEIFETKKKQSNHYLVAPSNPMARHTFVKIIDTRTVKIEPGFSYKNGYLGIDVDVFPVDGAPTDKNEYDKWFYSLKDIYSKVLLLNQKIEGYWKHVIKVCLCKLRYSKSKLMNDATKLHSLFEYNDSEFVDCVESPYCVYNTKVEKRYYSDTVYVEFEGKKYFAPVGYDAILSQIYGDYMKLPPEEQRVTHHLNNVFWKSR